ncbi:MAG: DivIVA domain-containing protein [Mycobacterium sp.]|uniref:DivIVA domain-containing protein n=1 Tax=Mycobacterium sp. TaxID=1785 RepID=UPI003F94BD8D
MPARRSPPPRYRWPTLGRRGYHEDQVDAFLDRVEAALVGPRESNASGISADEESAASGEPIRCLLHPYPTVRRKRQPPLVVDVCNDVTRVSDPNTNALIASAALRR